MLFPAGVCPSELCLGVAASGPFFEPLGDEGNLVFQSAFLFFYDRARYGAIAGSDGLLR